MPRRKIDPASSVVRMPTRTGAGRVTLARETELLLEIARVLAREAAREAFDRALTEMNCPGPENTE